MKIFISWSGKLSHEVALSLKEWIPSVIQNIKPYVSSEDIEKGGKWFSDVSNELEASDFGILCITKRNINAPWLLFEAGALSKSVSRSRVVPFLINVKPSELKSPLSQFQAVEFKRKDLYKLMKTINNLATNDSITEQKLNKHFNKWWDDLETSINECLSDKDKADISNTEIKISDANSNTLEEILKLCREMSYNLNEGVVLINNEEIISTRKKTKENIPAPNVITSKNKYRNIDKTVSNLIDKGATPNQIRDALSKNNISYKEAERIMKGLDNKKS